MSSCVLVQNSSFTIVTMNTLIYFSLHGTRFDVGVVNCIKLDEQEGVMMVYKSTDSGTIIVLEPI